MFRQILLDWARFLILYPWNFFGMPFSITRRTFTTRVVWYISTNILQKSYDYYVYPRFLQIDLNINIKSIKVWWKYLQDIFICILQTFLLNFEILLKSFYLLTKCLVNVYSMMKFRELFSHFFRCLGSAWQWLYDTWVCTILLYCVVRTFLLSLGVLSKSWQLFVYSEE